MLGDFFTKPLQGRLFRMMRDVVHGITSYETFVEETVETKTASKASKTSDDTSETFIEEVSTDQEERVVKRKVKKEAINVKRVRFIDGVESSNMRKVRTYAEVAKSRRNQ